VKPQEPIPHNYSMGKLNAIFAFSALALLAVTGLIVGYDYVRGWKWFQAEFMRIQEERIQSELAAAQTSANKEQLADIDKQIKDQTVAIARNRQQYLLAQKDLDSWEGKHYAADEDYRFAKAVLDAKRYDAEAASVQKTSDRAAKRRDFLDNVKKVNDLQLRLQQVTRDRDVARARVDEWLKKIADLENKKKDLTATIDLLTKQLQTVEMKGPNLILNLPMLDFVNPTLKIDQVVLPDLFVDVNYMHLPRVDRCQTCHRAIDRLGFESKKEAQRQAGELQKKLDAYQIVPEKRKETAERIAQLKRIQDAPEDILNPFRTHPRLDMFVGSASPHPLLDFGCTSCHRGQDRATEFGRAGHVPPNPKMERRWKGARVSLLPGPWDYKQRQWGYEENPFLETPMFPRQYYEAGCIKCHSGQIAVDGGEHINKATATVELYGCYACHKIANWRFTDLRKPGPDLNGIAEKTTPEWAVRWISEPHDFRSTTRMPSFFYQRNMNGPYVPAPERVQNLKNQNAEIHAIVAFLFAKSTHRVWPAPSVAGDAGRGKQLVENVGCLGCHIESEQIKDEKSGQIRLARREDYPLERNFGFNFTGVGTKTHPGWVFNWIKNPKNYYADAPMPSLRLSDQEAADVTAYLMSLQKPQFMARKVDAPDATAVHDLAKGYLVNTLSDRDAEARLRSMPLQEQLVYLGQRSIEKYGCYSCHNIRGFENLKPIGTELTTEGSKALHLFDFGFVHEYEHESGKHEHLQHNVPSWIYNKVRSPRVFDDKREKVYNDKLKMPNFRLTEEEARNITMVISGLTKDLVASNRLAAQDPHSRMIEEGRKRVSQHNCRACHVVDGYGRAIGSLIADTNFLPPDLSPEGARAQSPFLFNFLKDPSTMKIRPWLTVRMPTFHFSDDEANTLVSFFAGEGKAQPFDTKRVQSPVAGNVAVGREVFNMMRCTQCHSTTPVNPESPPPADLASMQSLAPNLTLSRLRLRHEWIPDWIRRPGEMIPSTRMPANFPRDAATGGFQSPLALAIDTPAFAVHKTALLPYFHNDEKELRRTMSDAVALTDYLRDYIWSIGITQMRAAGEGSAPTVTPLPPASTPPAPAMKTGRAADVPPQRERVRAAVARAVPATKR
jgi:cbb3-type cytochrome oxidase cytochrome c subunit